MRLALALDLTSVRNGGGGVALDAPVLVWTSGMTDGTPEFTSTLTLPLVSDTVQLQIATDVNFSTIVFDDINTLDAGEVADGEALFTSTALTSGAKWARARHGRTGRPTSDWSNVETKTLDLYTPRQFATPSAYISSAGQRQYATPDGYIVEVTG